MELTVLMPCLNEADTLAVCIRKAMRFLSENGIDGEVLVSDNGSTDGSQEIAVREGARVVHAQTRGYGAALRAGCQSAKGKYVIMGDADDSYDFTGLAPFLEKLREGYDLVMGNRFAGGIERGAMPWSHRYVGNPVLSFIGRLFFHSSLHDFHCGLRGYRRAAILALDLQTTGMESASEMVVKAELNGLKIAEVPTRLRKDGRSRSPHLRSIHDGWRHLKFLLMYAPNWLLLYPGLVFIFLGLILGGFLVVSTVSIHQVRFSIHTLLYCACSIIIGTSIIQMYLIVKTYAYNHALLPRGRIDWNRQINEDRIIAAGGVLTVIGIICSALALYLWKRSDLGDMDPEATMRLVIPAVLCLTVGIQSVCAGFAIGVLKIRTEKNDDKKADD